MSELTSFHHDIKRILEQARGKARFGVTAEAELLEAATCQQFRQVRIDGTTTAMSATKLTADHFRGVTKMIQPNPKKYLIKGIT